MLSKLNHMRESREQGFTLIELLVVILIIGILAAIAIPMFLNQRKAAVDSSVQSDVSNAAKQIETWIVQQGSTVEDLPISSANETDVYATGTTAYTGTDALAEIKVSDGTTLSFSGDSFGYFIQGTNSGGDVSAVAIDADPDASSTGVVYDSANGGLK